MTSSEQEKLITQGGHNTRNLLLLLGGIAAIALICGPTNMILEHITPDAADAYQVALKACYDQMAASLPANTNSITDACIASVGSGPSPVDICGMDGFLAQRFASLSSTNIGINTNQCITPAGEGFLRGFYGGLRQLFENGVSIFTN